MLECCDILCYNWSIALSIVNSNDNKVHFWDPNNILITLLGSSIVLTIEEVMSKLIPMVTKWKEIGEALKFDEDHLDEIFTNNETDEGCLQAMLEFYFKNSDFEHTWEEIDRAIEIANAKGWVKNLNSISLFLSLSFRITPTVPHTYTMACTRI